MKKKLVNKTIFKETGNNPIPFVKIKDIIEDNDVIIAGYDEGHYSENNSWDNHYYLEIIREVLETDEEFEKRKKRVEQQKIWDKERRKQTYLKLKKEFEDDNTRTKR